MERALRASPPEPWRERLLLALIAAAVAVASAQVFAPTLGSGDAYEFAVVQRAMAETGDWVKVDADNGIIEITKKANRD